MLTIDKEALYQADSSESNDVGISPQLFMLNLIQLARQESFRAPLGAAKKSKNTDFTVEVFILLFTLN